MANLIHSVLPEFPRKIVFIHPEDTVRKCIDIMIEQDIGALVVVDKNDQLIGIVSERDIVRSCLHHCVDLNRSLVSEVVFTKVSILSPHDTVEKAMQIMTETKRRHVLIYENDQLVAILSIGDLLYHILEDKSAVIKHLEDYITT